MNINLTRLSEKNGSYITIKTSITTKTWSYVEGVWPFTLLLI